MYILNSDESELKFPEPMRAERKRFRAEPSRAQYMYYVLKRRVQPLIIFQEIFLSVRVTIFLVPVYFCMFCMFFLPVYQRFPFYSSRQIWYLKNQLIKDLLFVGWGSLKQIMAGLYQLVVLIWFIPDSSSQMAVLILLFVPFLFKTIFSISSLILHFQDSRVQPNLA